MNEQVLINLQIGEAVSHYDCMLLVKTPVIQMVVTVYSYRYI